MSAALWEMRLRLEAAQAGRTIPRVSCAQVELSPRSLAVGVVGMPGAQAAVWGLAIGPLGTRTNPGTPTLISIPEPRDYQSMVDIFSQLYRVLKGWAWWVNELNPPQIIVADENAWKVLDTSAERLLRTTVDVGARRAAEILHWVARTAYVPGGQVLVPMVELLRRHLITPGDPIRESELDTWLGRQPVREQVWVTPDMEHKGEHGGPGLVDLSARYQLARREAHRAGTAEHPDAEQVAAHQQAMDAEAAKIAAVIQDLAKQRYEAVAEAAWLWQSHQLPLLPGVKLLQKEATQEFERWRERILKAEDNIFAFSHYYHVIEASADLIQRETAASEWEQSLVWHDEMVAKAAIAEGTAIWGRVHTNVGRQLVLDSPQQVLRVRPGDRLRIRTDRTKVTAASISLVGTGHRIVFDMVREVKTLQPGDVVVVCKQEGQLNKARSDQIKTRQRLYQDPLWALDIKLKTPAPTDQRVPTDLLEKAMSRRNPR